MFLLYFIFYKNGRTNEKRIIFVCNAIKLKKKAQNKVFETIIYLDAKFLGAKKYILVCYNINKYWYNIEKIKKS